MTALLMTTHYQDILSEIESVKSKSDDELKEIKEYVNEWRVRNESSGLSPSDLLDDLCNMGFNVDIYAATLLCDGEPRSLFESLKEEGEDLGATDREIKIALVDLLDAIYR